MNLLNKLCLPVLLLLLYSCYPPATDISQGDSWSQLVSEGEGILVVHYVPAEGFAYTDDGGRLTGVTVDILHEFLEWAQSEYSVDITPEFIPEESFSRFYRNVADSDEGVIGLANVTITDQRLEEVDFSPPYMQNIAVLITHESVAELSSFGRLDEQFTGMAALAFDGTLHQQRIEEIRDLYYPDLEIVMVHSNDDIINKLAGDSTLFSYIDIYNYWRASEQGEPLKRHEVGDDAAEEFGYILPRQSEWTPLITKFFEQNGGFTNSETYHRIMTEHLGNELTELLIE